MISKMCKTKYLILEIYPLVFAHVTSQLTGLPNHYILVLLFHSLYHTYWLVSRWDKGYFTKRHLSNTLDIFHVLQWPNPSALKTSVCSSPHGQSPSVLLPGFSSHANPQITGQLLSISPSIKSFLGNASEPVYPHHPRYLWLICSTLWS